MTKTKKEIKYEAFRAEVVKSIEDTKEQWANEYMDAVEYQNQKYGEPVEYTNNMEDTNDY